jgi:hypothetical protein
MACAGLHVVAGIASAVSIAHALIVGSSFPRKTAERGDFEEGAQRYYRRWDNLDP